MQPSMGKLGYIFECFPDDECDNRGGVYEFIGATFEEDVLDDGPLSKATGAFGDSSDIASHFERLWSEVETGNTDNLGKTLKLRSISYDALPMLGHAEIEGVLASKPPASPAGSCPVSAEPMPRVRSSSGLPSAPGQRAPARHILRLTSEKFAARGEGVATPTMGSGSDSDPDSDYAMSGSVARTLLRLRRLGSAEAVGDPKI